MTSPRAAFLPLYDPPGSLLDIGIHPLYRNSPALPAGYLTFFLYGILRDSFVLGSEGKNRDKS
jgi:hypothetical protein